jgi:pyrroloquinoline-quinone synthase
MKELMSGAVTGAAAMYSYEAEIPKIATSKINGLKELYGVTDSTTLEYFTEHEVADIEHVKVWKAMMEHFNKAEQETALKSAETCLKAQNTVLDSVCDRYMSMSTATC